MSQNAIELFNFPIDDRRLTSPGVMPAVPKFSINLPNIFGMNKDNAV